MPQKTLGCGAKPRLVPPFRSEIHRGSAGTECRNTSSTAGFRANFVATSPARGNATQQVGRQTAIRNTIRSIFLCQG
jgi:hypothetical protein